MMMTRNVLHKCLGFVGLLGAFVASPAYAWDWMIDSTVTNIEVTYMPDMVVFQIPVAAGTCASGALLAWNAKGSDAPAKIANVQAVLSVLLTAKTSGKPVRIYGNNTGCTVDFIHFP